MWGNPHSMNALLGKNYLIIPPRPKLPGTNFKGIGEWRRFQVGLSRYSLES